MTNFWGAYKLYKKGLVIPAVIGTKFIFFKVSESDCKAKNFYDVKYNAYDETAMCSCIHESYRGFKRSQKCLHILAVEMYIRGKKTR